jgi:aspartate/tyrosine/aromatic aminotransferase
MQPMPADAILGLIAEHRDDPRPEKIDLGVGVYRTARGETPILDTVKKAERKLFETQSTKAYIGTSGSAEFNAVMQDLTFADSVSGDRLFTMQTPGGSGALRVAAGILLRARENATVWVSEPTWANHIPLLAGAGLTLKTYPYYDTDNHVIRTEAMLEALQAVPEGDVVLFHACCHNPCGLDPSNDEWRAITDVVVHRNLVPFFDAAYQGFATGIEEDVFAVRYMAERVAEMIVCNSCSKNFGLYRDRVGTLSLLGADEDTASMLASNANNYVRTLYSMPPDHGGAIVSIILNDADLRQEWVAEVDDMRGRLQEMKELLHAALQEKEPDHDFTHLVRSNGMFCFLGVSADQVSLLKKDFGIYMVDSSRINVAGITPDNVDYLANSIAAVM